MKISGKRKIVQNTNIQILNISPIQKNILKEYFLLKIIWLMYHIFKYVERHSKLLTKRLKTVIILDQVLNEILLLIRRKRSTNLNVTDTFHIPALFTEVSARKKIDLVSNPWKPNSIYHLKDKIFKDISLLSHVIGSVLFFYTKTWC